MRVLLIEFNPSVGHKKLFENTSRYLSHYTELDTVIPSNYEYNIAGNPIKAPYKLRINIHGNKIKALLTVISSIRVILFARKLDDINHYDKIVCLTYHTVAFYFGRLLLRNRGRVCLMNHDNIDTMSRSKLKTKMFSSICRDVSNIVQCHFIKDYLVNELLLSPYKVGVWLHPLNQSERKFKSGKKYDLVGISGSNDESLIKEIYYAQKETGFLRKNNLSVLLKSSEFEYDDGYLRIIKGYLPGNEYNEYISGASIIFLPFPSDFQFRMSGTLVDALSNRKPIIAADNSLFRHCEKAYPNVVKIFNIKTLVRDVISLKEKSLSMEEEFDRFREIHNQEKLEKEMYDFLNNKSSENAICDF